MTKFKNYISECGSGTPELRRFADDDEIASRQSGVVSPEQENQAPDSRLTTPDCHCGTCHIRSGASQISRSKLSGPNRPKTSQTNLRTLHRFLGEFSRGIFVKGVFCIAPLENGRPPPTPPTPTYRTGLTTSSSDAPLRGDPVGTPVPPMRRRRGKLKLEP